MSYNRAQMEPDFPEPAELEAARRRFAELDARAAAAGERAPHVGDEARCALVMSSAGTWAATLRGEFVRLLVASGVWPASRARWLDRLNALHPRDLAALCAWLPEPERAAALGDALARARAWRSQSGLAAVAEHFAGAEREGLLREAVAAARTDINAFPRAMRLLKLAERFPPPEREALRAEVHTIARTLRDHGMRAWALRELAAGSRDPLATLDESLDAVRAIALAANRLDPYLELALVRAQCAGRWAGVFDEVLELAERLDGLARGIGSRVDRVIALVSDDRRWHLLVTLASLGDDGALAALQSDEEARFVGPDAHWLARWRALLGDERSAALLSPLFDAPPDAPGASRALEMVRCAAAALPAHRLPGALPVARRLEEPAPRADALELLARQLAPSDRAAVLQEALQSRARVRDDDARDELRAAPANTARVHTPSESLALKTCMDANGAGWGTLYSGDCSGSTESRDTLAIESSRAGNPVRWACCGRGRAAPAP